MTSIWNLLKASGLAPLARRAYVTAQTAPRFGHHTVRVSDLQVEFTTRTTLEYRRVRTFHGEKPIVESLLSDLAGDEVVWDVGANVGLYACVVAKALTTGQVIGFEPEPANRARLETNLAANAPGERWRTTEVALSDTDRSFWLASERSAPRRSEPGGGHHYLSTDGWLDVECRRGETLIDEGIPAPDVMKIDVEGAELKVLEGMDGQLDDVTTIYVEVHTEKGARYDTTPSEVEAFLEEEGFTLTSLGEPAWARSGVYHVRANR